MLAMLLIITIVLLISHSKPTKRSERWSSDGSETGNPKNIYDTNSWYRYAKHIAGTQNSSSCYVCSHLPPSSTHPAMSVTALDPRLSDCVQELASTGYWTNYTITNLTVTTGTQLRETCANMKPLTRINMTGLLNPFAQYTDTFKNAECYYRNGTVSVGNTPAARCNITWVDAGNGTQVNGTVTYNYTCPTGYKCGGSSPSAIPGQNGTYALDGVYWLCGHKL